MVGKTHYVETKTEESGVQCADASLDGGADAPHAPLDSRRPATTVAKALTNGISSSSSSSKNNSSSNSSSNSNSSSSNNQSSWPK